MVFSWSYGYVSLGDIHDHQLTGLLSIVIDRLILVTSIRPASLIRLRLSSSKSLMSKAEPNFANFVSEDVTISSDIEVRYCQSKACLTPST